MTGRFTPERIAGLVEGAASVARQVDLNSLLKSTVEIAMDLTGAHYGALGVLGDHGGLADFIHLGIDEIEADRIGSPPRGLGVLGTITHAAKTIRLDRIASHPDSVGFPDQHPPMDTFLGVPVRIGEEVFGNLYLTGKEGGFTEDDEILVEFLAITAGSAVSTLRLQERLRRAALLEDRERIARDLHDSIIQDLFAVGLSLQAAAEVADTDPDKVRTDIDDAVEQLDRSIGALRRYIFDLRPPVWARPSLRQQIADLVGQLSAPHRMRVGLDIDCPDGEVPGDMAEYILALIKEGVSNALRHSGGDEALVRVACGRSQVVVSITDDGRGFDPKGVTGGLGLVNMRERVDDAGGSFRVDTAAGKGTVVRMTLPI